MASRPRSTAFSTQSTQSRFPSKLNPAPEKRQKMTVTQTYYLAHTARGKLSTQAARPDHDLRLLVGHANLLDSLMSELADAEQEQEQWFNKTVKGAAKASEEPKHIQWADTIIEEPEEDWAVEDAESDSDSETDSEYDEDDDFEMASACEVSLQKVSSPSTAIAISATEIASDDGDEDYDDGEEDYGDLALVRTSSHQPPELLHDSDDSSDEESMPPSPPQPILPITSQQSKQPMSLSNAEQASFFDEGFYLPQRESTPIISVC